MSLKRTIIFVSSLLFWVALSTIVNAEYAVIYKKNGDRITGRWLESDEKYYRIKLEDGQRLRISVAETSHIMFVSDSSLVPNAEAEKHYRNGKAFLELEIYDKAKEQFFMAIDEFPKYAVAHYEIARMYEKEDDIENAMRYFGYVAAIDPEHYKKLASKFKSVGDRYLKRGELGKAAEAYLRLSKYFPDDPDAENSAYTSGFIFAEQLDEVDKAIDALSNAVENFPNNPDAEKTKYMLGWLYQRRGNNVAAIEKLTNFIEEYPNSQWLEKAYFARGQAYLQARLNQEAVADFNQVIDIAKNRDLIRKAKRMRDSAVWNIYTVEDKLPDNDIRAIAVDGNLLWVGTWKGLFLADVSDGTWTPLAIGDLDLTEIKVNAITVSDTEVWIGTLDQGLIRYDKQTGSTTIFTKSNGLPSNTLFSIELYQDEVWVGTYEGLGYYNKSTNAWEVFSRKDDNLPADDIVTIAVTPDTVWAGTSQSGIGIYDRKENTWRIYNTATELPRQASNNITSIDTDGFNVWFSWYKMEDANGYVKSDLYGRDARAADLLRGSIDPVENIYLKLNVDQVWIATNAGIFIGSRTSGWSTVNYPDRLGDMRVKCLALGEKEAWVGTSNGLARVSISNILNTESSNSENPE